MDIASATDQANNVMSLDADWNQRLNQVNARATTTANNTIRNAQAKQSLLKGYDEGSIGAQTGATFLTGAKVVGDARNFDSEVAGFGTGRGTSGYLRSQGQIIKGRMGQASQRLGVAVGTRDADDVAKSGADLGLSQTKMGTRTQLVRSNRFSPFTEQQVPEMQTGGADATKLVGDTDEGRAVAKASGGLFSATGKAEEGGMVGGVVKKVGKFVSDLPEGQLGAVGDVVGKGLGVFSAGKGIYDDVVDKDWSKDTGAQKVANVGDIVAGGLDALSVAIPMLAPVGAVASGISAALDIGAQADTEKATEKSAKATQQGASVPGEQAPSLSSAGLVAKQQLSAY